MNNLINLQRDIETDYSNGGKTQVIINIDEYNKLKEEAALYKKLILRTEQEEFKRKEELENIFNEKSNKLLNNWLEGLNKDEFVFMFVGNSIPREIKNLASQRIWYIARKEHLKWYLIYWNLLKIKFIDIIS